MQIMMNRIGVQTQSYPDYRQMNIEKRKNTEKQKSIEKQKSTEKQKNTEKQKSIEKQKNTENWEEYGPATTRSAQEGDSDEKEKSIISKAEETRKELLFEINKKSLYEQLNAAKDAGKGMDQMAKILQIAMHISMGDTVSPKDEQTLMEYNPKLYMAAKSAAVMHKNEKHRKCKQIVEDEETDSKRNGSEEEKRISQYDSVIKDLQEILSNYPELTQTANTGTISNTE